MQPPGNPDSTDEKLIEIVQWVKQQDPEVQRRLYTSLYYDVSAFRDGSELGWPAPVQDLFPDCFSGD